MIWNILVIYLISQHLARLPSLRFIKIGLCQFSLYTSNCPHDRVSRVSQFCLPSRQLKTSPLNSSTHVIGQTCESSFSSPSTTMMTSRCLIIEQSLYNNSPPPLPVSISTIRLYHCIRNDQISWK